LDFSKGMKDEHCVMWGFNVMFKTSNYGLRTTPQKEYEISAGLRPCPAEDMNNKHGRRVRVIRPIEELKQIRLSQRADLTDDEILAVVRVITQNTFAHLEVQCTNTMLAGAVFRTYVSGVQHDPPSVPGGRVQAV
jgi:hypothetical protein